MKNNYIYYIVFTLIGVLIGAGVMMIIHPLTISKIENGSEVVVSIDGKNITANELYNGLKTYTGLDEALELVDNEILKDYYKDDLDAAKKYANEQAEYYYEMYKEYYNMSKDEFLENNGFTEESFIEYLNNEYFYDKLYDEYVLEMISDEDILNEYNNNYYSNRDIFIFYGEDEDTVKSAKKAYDKGTSVEKIKSKYTSVTVEEIESLDYSASTDYSDEFNEHVKNTKELESSEVFDDSIYGYMFITVASEQESQSYEDMYETLQDVIMTKMKSDDSSLSNKSIIELRKKYNIKFYDEELEKYYNTYIKSYE